MSVIALVIATVIPLAVLVFIFTRDLYGTGDFRNIVSSFIWGGLAFALASSVNLWMISSGLADKLTVTRFSAPIAEEILKAAFLIYLVRRPHFTYFVDGAIYGFAVGIGFAVFENYQYILANESVALSVAFGRVLSTNLVHAAASAIVGIAFGLSRFEKTIGRVWLQTLGFLIAMLLHIGFNVLVTTVNNYSGFLLVYATVVGFASFGIIWAAIRKGLEDEKDWIKETLGDADRVTAEEAAVVHNLSNVESILAPLAERFGPEKASIVEHFLTLEARLGIMRKTLEKLPDKDLVEMVENEMAEIREEMDVARRKVGTLTMMYLRGIFPEDDDTLWGHFEDVIEQRIAMQPRTSSGGLWEHLDTRSSQNSKTSHFDELS